MLEINIKYLSMLIKYIGGLHSHLQNTIMLFDPVDFDKTCVQA